MDTKVKQLEDEIGQLKAQVALLLQLNQALTGPGAASASAAPSQPPAQAHATPSVVIVGTASPKPDHSGAAHAPASHAHSSSSGLAPHGLTTSLSSPISASHSPGPGEDEFDGTQASKDSLSIEEKKNLKRVLISKKQLSELKRQRSVKLSDLVRIPTKVPSQPQPSSSASRDTTLLGDWPLELVLVRHGQSEGNEAVARSQHGDLSAYTPEFKNKHSSTYRLTDKGVQQAKVAGQWIRENIGDKFDRY